MTDEQFAELKQLLTEIRDALSPAIVETDECPHPAETRVDLSTFSDPDHWICRACQHEHQGFVQV